MFPMSLERMTFYKKFYKNKLPWVKIAFCVLRFALRFAHGSRSPRFFFLPFVAYFCLWGVRNTCRRSAEMEIEAGGTLKFFLTSCCTRISERLFSCVFFNVRPSGRFCHVHFFAKNFFFFDAEGNFLEFLKKKQRGEITTAVKLPS